MYYRTSKQAIFCKSEFTYINGDEMLLCRREKKTETQHGKLVWRVSRILLDACELKLRAMSSWLNVCLWIFGKFTVASLSAYICLNVCVYICEFQHNLVVADFFFFLPLYTHSSDSFDDRNDNDFSVEMKTLLHSCKQ